MIGAGFNGSTIGFAPKGTCMEAQFPEIVDPNPDTLSISGQVYALQESVANANVVAIETNTQKGYAVATDQADSFKLKNLPKGTYIIKAEPASSLNNSFITTYFPKKATLEEAISVSLGSHISQMKIYLLVNPIMGIEDTELNAETYPNPFNNELLISNTTSRQVLITDLTGRIIYSNSANTQNINTSSWQQGVYIIKMGKTTRRIVKE